MPSKSVLGGNYRAAAQAVPFLLVALNLRFLDSTLSNCTDYCIPIHACRETSLTVLAIAEIATPLPHVAIVNPSGRLLADPSHPSAWSTMIL